MSTRSWICKTNNKMNIERIYCHWDGYPEGVGKTLRDNYNTPEKVVELLKLGSISALREKLEPEEGAIHTFDEPLDDVTIAYHRDRGESWEHTQPRTDSRILETFENALQSDAEYVYIYTPLTSWSSETPDYDYYYRRYEPYWQYWCINNIKRTLDLLKMNLDWDAQDDVWKERLAISFLQFIA